MGKHLDSKIKTCAIKCLVFCLGICYMVNPLHQGIFNIMHDVSHIIVPQDDLMSTSHDHPEEEFHEYHDHDQMKTHSHKTINLLATLIFTVTDFENNILLSSDSIDKHISTKILTIPKILPSVIKNDDPKPVKKVIAGFLEIIELPPRPCLQLTKAINCVS